RSSDYDPISLLSLSCGQVTCVPCIMSRETRLLSWSSGTKSATNLLWKARSFMAIKTIPLSRLETDLEKTLNECAESGEIVVVEMPDQRLLAIQPLDPQEDDTLM